MFAPKETFLEVKTASLCLPKVIAAKVQPNVPGLMIPPPPPQGPNLASSTVLHVFVQMVNSIRKCHEYGIVHKDVKLDNWLTDGADTCPAVALTDFGLSRHASDRQACVCGTPWTLSPQGFSDIDDREAGDW